MTSSAAMKAARTIRRIKEGAGAMRGSESSAHFLALLRYRQNELPSRRRATRSLMFISPPGWDGPTRQDPQSSISKVWQLLGTGVLVSLKTEFYAPPWLDTSGHSAAIRVPLWLSWGLPAVKLPSPSQTAGTSWRIPKISHNSPRLGRWGEHVAAQFP